MLSNELHRAIMNNVVTIEYYEVETQTKQYFGRLIDLWS